MFYGASFLFNNISAEEYDLRILNFDSGGNASSPAGSDIAIYQKYAYRKSKPYLFGTSQNIPLEFDLTIGSGTPISGELRNLIEDWLLGKKEYLPLQIVQDDLETIIFNVLFTKSSVKYVGNLDYGFVLHAQCDAPWGFEYPKTLTKTYSGSAIVNETFTFYNDSADADYLYPSIVFTTSGTGTGLSIINNTDNSREFAFAGISAGETVTIDNDKQIISSSTGLLRMSKFNKKFFRLLPKSNSLTMVGGITSFVMTYQFAKKVGA